MRPAPSLPEVPPRPDYSLMREAGQHLNDSVKYREMMAQALHCNPEDILEPGRPDFEAPQTVNDAFRELFGENGLSIGPDSITSCSEHLPPSLQSVSWGRDNKLTFEIELRLARGTTGGYAPAISIDELDAEVKSIVELRSLLAIRGYSEPKTWSGGPALLVKFSKEVPPEQVADELNAFMAALANARPEESWVDLNRPQPAPGQRDRQR